VSSTEKEKHEVTYDPTVIGSTGLRQYGGFVAEEFLKELAGVKGSRVYREMADNDATVGAVLFAVTTLIRQSDWTVQAVDDSIEGEAAKTFLEEVMHDMSVPWSVVVGEACSMFTYGYAPMEIIYKKRQGPDAKTGEGRSAYSDGKIGVRSISLRAQPTIVRWDFDPVDGSILGYWQQPWAGPMVYIPIEKTLLFRTSEERNNPEGRSILRTAYRPWYFKKRIEEIEAIGVERDLAGLPIAMIPGRYFNASADPADKKVLSEWQRLVTSIRRDQREGIIMPSDRDQSGNLLYELKLLSTGGSRTFDTTKVIDRYNRAIATSVLADFIFLGQQAIGSFALSSDKTALFATAIGAFSRSIEDVFNRHLIPRLWKLNGFDFEFMPQLRCGDLEKPNLAELAQYLTSLSGAGAQLFPDRELENYLRSAAGLPLAPEEGIETDDMGDGEGGDEGAEDGENEDKTEE
jgi:hypothetical protein